MKALSSIHIFVCRFISITINLCYYTLDVRDIGFQNILKRYFNFQLLLNSVKFFLGSSYKVTGEYVVQAIIDLGVVLDVLSHSHFVTGLQFQYDRGSEQSCGSIISVCMGFHLAVHFYVKSVLKQRKREQEAFRNRIASPRF